MECGGVYFQSAHYTNHVVFMRGTQDRSVFLSHLYNAYINMHLLVESYICK